MNNTKNYTVKLDKSVDTISQDFGKNNEIKLYGEMLNIRLIEEKISDEYHNDDMKTPVHLYIGQEAIAVGVCDYLTKSDWVFSNHRSHGHYIAKGGDVKGLFAELFCKEHGCGGGYSGSMHLIDIKNGLPGTSAIVGGGIPIGVGAAFAFKYRKEQNISVIFFGDGAADEGVLYESVNFAVLRQLPVLFVCENNEIAVASPYSHRQATKIYKRFQNMIPSFFVNGNDVEAVNNLAGRLIGEIRSGDGPRFMECATNRIKAHDGGAPNPSVEPAIFKKWEKECPIKVYRDKLIKQKMLNKDLDEKIHNQLSQEIEAAFLFGRNDILPESNKLLNKMFTK